MHQLAHDLIREGIRLPRNGKTLNRYVNDCIGWGMTPEQILYYSDNAFGTADAISFRNMILRISDLETGETPASEKQLEVYAAFFCLESVSYTHLDVYKRQEHAVQGPVVLRAQVQRRY